MTTALKKLFRSLYYFFQHNKVVRLEGYAHLEQTKWIINRRFDRAYYKGYYEPRLTSYILQNLPPDGTFVDVGAHAGYFSVFAARLAREGSVMSFEPDRANYSFIKKIRALNDINNWRVVNEGVGSRKGKMYFNTGRTSSTGSVSERGEQEISVTTLDEALDDLSRVDIIKVDVEGFGGRLIEGALRTIEKFRPKIMFEVHAGSDELECVFRHLANAYRFFDIDTGQTVSPGSKPDCIICEPKEIS